MKIAVLLVDDDPQLALAVFRAQHARWTITFCSTGDEAIEVLASPAEYDAILLDLFMPQGTGPDVWEALGERAPARRERVIFFTAGAELAKRWLEETGRPVVRKPVDGETLAAVVDRVSRQKGPRGPTYKREPLPHDTPHLRAARELVDQRIEREIEELHRNPRRSYPELLDDGPDAWDVHESQTGSHIIVHASPPLRVAIEETVERMKRLEELRAAAGRWATIVRWWKLWWEKFGVAFIMLVAGLASREILVLLAWLWKIAKK